MGQSSSFRPKQPPQVVQEDPASLEDTIPTGFFSSLQQQTQTQLQSQGEERVADDGSWGKGYDEDHRQDRDGVQYDEGRDNEQEEQRVNYSTKTGEDDDDEEEEVEEDTSESLTPLGMNLRFVEEFYNECGGKAALEGLTVSDVFGRLILNFMEHSPQQSFNEHLRAQAHPSVGPASVFVSVSWKYDFVDVMDALQSFLQHGDTWNDDCYVWFDFYSGYHHRFRVAEGIDYSEWESLLCRARDLFGVIHLIHIPWNHSFVQERNFFVERLESTLDMVNINKVARFGVELIKNYINFMDETVKTEQEIVENVDVRYRLINEMGRLYELGGEHTDADMLYKKALYDMRAEEYLGTYHYNTVVLMNDFALLMCDVDTYGSSKLDNAEKLYRECISILETLTKDSKKHVENRCPLESDVIIVKNNLACLYELQGKYEDALHLHTFCVNNFTEMLGPHHSLSILSKNNLATVYLQTVESLDACPENPEHVYEDCIQVCYKVENSSKKDKLWSIVYMTNLASVYFQVGHNLELAEPLLRDCLEQLKTLRGERHLDTLHAMYILAMFYFENDRLDDAEQLLLNIVQLANESLGRQHRFTLSTMNSLSVAIGKSGKHEEALSVGIDCYEACLEAYGADDHDTLASINSLSIIYNALHEYEEAERLLMTCIEKLTSSLESPSSSPSSSPSAVLSPSISITNNLRSHRTSVYNKHLLLIECLLNISKSYMEMNMLEKAEKNVSRCVNEAVKSLGESNPLTLEAKHAFAGLMEKLERFDESEALYTRCLEGRRMVLGETHSDTLTTMNDLGYLYTRQKRYEEAEHMYLSCLSIASPVTGVVCMSNLGLLYSLLGRYEEAEPLLSDCVEKRRAIHGDDHYLTKVSEDHLKTLIEFTKPSVNHNDSGQSENDGNKMDHDRSGEPNRSENHEAKYLEALGQDINTARESYGDRRDVINIENISGEQGPLQSSTNLNPSSPAGNVRRSSFESPRAAKHIVDNGSNSERSSFDSPSMK